MKKYILVFIFIFLQLATYNLQLTLPLAFALEEPVFVYDSQGVRDPFMPLLTKDGKPITAYAKIGSISDIVIEGILYDPQGESVVIINDLILKQGSSINGITVKSIERNSVVLSFKGEDHTFKIKE